MFSGECLRVEVSNGCVLALRKGNELVTSALDDGKGNEVSRHLDMGKFEVGRTGLMTEMDFGLGRWVEQRDTPGTSGINFDCYMYQCELRLGYR